jgi:PilZ domain
MPCDALPVDVRIVEEADRRSCPRLPGIGLTLVRPEGKTQSLARTGKIVDVSETGIGLLLNCRFPEDTVVSLSPCGWITPYSLKARVVHNRQVGDHWFHGCQFVHPISKKDLLQWVTFGLVSDCGSDRPYDRS